LHRGGGEGEAVEDRRQHVGLAMKGDVSGVEGGKGDVSGVEGNPMFCVEGSATARLAGGGRGRRHESGLGPRW
jgi:hypothetical protein